MENKNTISSAITRNSIQTPQLDTESLNSITLSINNKTVSDITDLHNETSPTSLVTAFALDQGKKSISVELEKLANLVNSIIYAPVLSDPIVSPHFLDVNWILEETILDNGKLIYINKKPNEIQQARFKVKSDAIIKKGNYFFDIYISQLTSGNIKLINEEGTVLQLIETPGFYRFESTVNDPSVAFFEFTINNVEPNHIVIIDYISICYVKSAFSVYMDYAAAKITSGGSGFVSLEQLQLAINNVLELSKAYTNSAVNTFGGDFTIHMGNTSNPHNVTHDQVGAAPEVHYHSQYAHIAEIAAWTTEHLSAINPHNVTHDQVGAAPTVHQHTADDLINISVIGHKHILTDITDISDIYNKFDTLTEELTKLTDKHNKLQETSTVHATNYKNPHNVNKMQIGLSDVVNGRMATRQEAIDGVLDNIYINPRNVSDILTHYSDVADKIIQTLTPKPIANFTLDFENPTINIPVSKDRIYHISIHMTTVSLKLLELNLVSDINLIHESCFLIPKTTNINGTNETTLGHVYSTGNSWTITPPSYGMNIGEGNLTLNTFNMSLTGTILGKISIDNTISQNIYPIQIAHQLAITPTSSNIPIFQLKLINPDRLSTISILIYELIPTQRNPNMVVDATPVGSIITRFGNFSIFPGYCQLDGSELSKSLHMDLFNFAQDNRLIINKSTYHNEVSNNGHITKFGYDEGDTTFLIPQDPISDNNTYRYIKIDNVSIPDSSQLLYRYVWNN